jgi:putative nucleotidyltransferase with HDIG domain
VIQTTSGRKSDIMYSCPGKGEQLTSLARSVSTQIHTQKAILDRLSKPTLDPKELSEMVESDPSLAGKILKTINSSYYGLMEPVGSVFRAVLLLGHVEVRNTVWRSCISGSLKPVSGPANEIHDSIWRHSFIVSRAAHELAKQLNIPNPDVVSTAALLHDIGRVIFLSVSPEQALALYQPVRFSDQQLLVEEERVIGLPHMSLGSEIARMWGLPGTTRAMIQHHHAPSYIDPDGVTGNPKAIAVVHIADLLSHLAASDGEHAEHQMYLPRKKWLNLLGVEHGLAKLCTSNVLEVLAPKTGPGDAGARAA